MLLAEVVETSRQISATTKRLEKVQLLSGLLRRLLPVEAEIVVAFLSGRTRQGKIGIGYGALREALPEPAATAGLEITNVDQCLTAISAIQGSGSARARAGQLTALLAMATAPEQQFLTSLLVGELRQGALEGIMLDAIGRAASIPLDAVRRATMMAGDIIPVASAALGQGAAGLAQFEVKLFRPVQPMLAQTAEDIGEALVELGEAALEYKVDGARVQAHKSGDDVILFSRSLKDVTLAVPEIVEAVRALPAKDLVLDGEIVSLRADGSPQPFQVTARRFGRKLDLDRVRAEIPLTPFWFDMLYLNGGSIMDEPQAKRFRALRDVAGNSVIPNTTATNVDQADEFLKEALNRGHEGIMAKGTHAPYAAGARGQSWLKVKHVHTLDLVILAAEWGNGRRRGFLSNLHLGARDAVRGGFAMLGKTFKGLTDDMLAWQTQEFLKIEVARDRYTVYLEPKIVVEIAFNDIQISSRYVSGLALRFARVKRYRTDKTADDADTFETVQQLAISQGSQKS